MSESPELKLAEELIAYAIRGKLDDGVYQRYDDSKKYYAGEHKIRNRSKTQGNKVVNKYAEIHEGEVAQITEALPKWYFKPQGDDDIITADMANQVIGDVIWDKNEWYLKGDWSVDEAAHAGSSVIKTRVGMDGYPYFDVLSNDEFFPDPLITEHGKMRFCVHAVPMTVKDIKRQFKKDVASEDILESQAKGIGLDRVLKSFEQQSKTNMRFNMNAYRGGMNSISRSGIMPEKIGMAMTFHVYLNDETKEQKKFEIKETDNEHVAMLQGRLVSPSADENHVEHLKAHKAKLANLDVEGPESTIAKALALHIRDHEKFVEEFPEYAEKQKKYPYGRRIIVCQGIVLKDSALEVPIHWQNLFVKWDWMPRKGCYWGKGLGHDNFDPQDLLNHRANSITKNINNINYGLTILRAAGQQNLKKDHTFTNEIAQVITTADPQRDVVRSYGPPLPNSFWQDLTWIEGHMERKAHVNDIKSGAYPKGSPANATIETLLQQGMKPNNAVVRRYSAALKQMARNAMVIMTIYLPDDEKFYITGKDPQTVRWGDIKNFGYKDIRVDVIGQLTTSRDRQLQTALMMKQYGVYDNMAVLDAIDDPKKFEIAQRMNEVAELQKYVVNQEQVIGIYKQELQKMQSELNTFYNRQQGSDGGGNVANQEGKPKG